MTFVQSGGRSRAGDSRVGASSRAEERLVGGGGGGGGGGKAKQKSKEKDNKEKRSSSSKEKSPGKSQSKSEKRGVDDVEAAPVAATVEREWQPTRSVLQQGARETGVKVGAHQPGQGLR